MDDHSNSRELTKYASALCPAITEDLSPDQACRMYEMAEAFKRAVNEWFEGKREEMTEYVKAQPDGAVAIATVEGERFYVVKTEKRKRLAPGMNRELVERCFEDMSFDEIVEVLSSAWAKPGALARYLHDADRFIEVVESESPKLQKTMPPAMKARLAASDKALATEGGGA